MSADNRFYELQCHKYAEALSANYKHGCFTRQPFSCFGYGGWDTLDQVPKTDVKENN